MADAVWSQDTKKQRVHESLIITIPLDLSHGKLAKQKTKHVTVKHTSLSDIQETLKLPQKSHHVVKRESVMMESINDELLKGYEENKK